MTQSLPTPTELAPNPEIALLESLELQIELTNRMMATTYPELCDEGRPYWAGAPPSELAPQARKLLETMGQARLAIREYRRAVSEDAKSAKADEVIF